MIDWDLFGSALLLMVSSFLAGFFLHSLWICSKCKKNSDQEIIDTVLKQGCNK